MHRLIIIKVHYYMFFGYTATTSIWVFWWGNCRV